MVQLERVADVMEASAGLAEQHAEAHRRRGRAFEAVTEHRRARFAKTPLGALERTHCDWHPCLRDRVSQSRTPGPLGD